MDQSTKDFLYNYEINILNDYKRKIKMRSPTFFTDPYNSNVIQNRQIDCQEEKVFTLEIPEGRFRTLVELEKRFFKMQKHSRTELDLFEVLMDKEREETFLRETNEAVKKAYENYSMMLHLAGYEKKI